MKDNAENSEDAHGVEQRFLASVSHEIRTPLNGILGFASLLAETDLSAAQADYVGAIRQSGARLLDLLNNVLDYAHMDATGVDLECSDVNLAHLAQDVAELLSPRAHERGLDICVRTEPGFPALLSLDDGRMRQVLFNLCGNAIKFTETGGVLIDLLTEKDFLKIRVVDSGPGLAKKDQEKLFDAFGQAEASHRGRDGGVGLGLAIVSRLIHAMRGEIRIISEKGLGACFEISLPLPEQNTARRQTERANLNPLRIGLYGLSAPLTLSLSAILTDAGHTPLITEPGDEVDVWIAEAGAPPAVLKQLADAAPLITLIRPEDRRHVEALREMGSAAYLMRPIRRASLFARLAALQADGALPDNDENSEDVRDLCNSPPLGGRILIADDNAVNALLATRTLEKAGYHCITAATGAEAVETMQNQEIDLILMDLRMPVMDGYEAMRQIRGLDSPRADTPMIAISAEVNPDVERKARASGANAVASKPLDAQTLRELAVSWRRKAKTA